MEHTTEYPKEKRRFPRCQAPVLVRCHDIQEPTVQVRSVSRDISGAGIRFPVTERLRSGALVELQLEISPNHAPMCAQGEVRWLREFSRIGAPQYEVGVEFTDMSAADSRRLIAYCSRWFVNRMPTLQ